MSPVHESPSFPLSPEPKKNSGEHLHRMMKEYLEKVKSLCAYACACMCVQLYKHKPLVMENFMD